MLSSNTEKKLPFLQTRYKILTDNEEKEQIIHRFHTSLDGMHDGTNHLLTVLRYKLKDIAEYVQKCKICELNKRNYNIKKLLLRFVQRLVSSATEYFEKIFFDLIGPFPISELSNTVAFTACCCFLF